MRFFIIVTILFTNPAIAEFVYPVGNPAIRPQPTGYPNNNGFQITREFANIELHTGIDLSNSLEGGEVRSITDGTVVIRCDATDPTDTYACYGFGNLLIIEHNLPEEKYYSLYAHLKHGSLLVNQGDPTTAGQAIAQVNCTGYTIGSSRCESNGGKGPHVHFAVKKLKQIGCAYVGEGKCKSGETIADYESPLEFIANHRNSTLPYTVKWLKFAQGDPSQPGDGKVITLNTKSTFYPGETFPMWKLLTPIGLRSAANGLTFGVFDYPESGNTGMLLIGYDNGLPKSDICYIRSRAVSFLIGFVEVNGIQGIRLPFRSEEYSNLVDVANQNRKSGCPTMTINDFYITHLSAVNSAAGMQLDGVFIRNGVAP